MTSTASRRPWKRCSARNTSAACRPSDCNLSAASHVCSNENSSSCAAFMSKKRLAISLVIVAVLAALAYLQFRTWRHFRWDVFLYHTREANPWKIAFGVALIYWTYYLRAIRWKVLLRPTKRVPIRELTGPMFIGFTGVALLGRPGDLIRPFLISKRQELSLPSQIAVLAVERIFDIGCFALLLLVDLLFAPSLRELPYYSEFRFAGIMLAFVVAAAALVVFLIWRKPEAFANWVEAKLSRAMPKLARTLCEKIKTF